MKIERVRKATKFVAMAIVGAGTTKIVSQIISNNTDHPDKKIEQIQIGVASAVAGTMAAERAKSYTDAKIDMFFDRWERAGTTEPDIIEGSTTDPQ